MTNAFVEEMKRNDTINGGIHGDSETPLPTDRQTHRHRNEYRPRLNTEREQNCKIIRGELPLFYIYLLLLFLLLLFFSYFISPHAVR